MLTLADIMLSLGDPDISGIRPQLAELEKVPVREAVIDSRQVMRGDLFVALPGEHVDGHVFVGHALGRGAIAAFVNQDIDLTDIPDAVWLDVRQASLPASLKAFHYIEGKGLILRVDDALTALQRLSALWRLRFAPGLRVVGITGSVGKTTTKELIAQVLGTRFNVLKNEGNRNNEIGVPLTLLQLRPEHQVAVIEMGMYKLGEIALFAKLA
ncbi:MAG TPA: Mur ligase family protein, partial [Anaerolineae bacterium]